MKQFRRLADVLSRSSDGNTSEGTTPMSNFVYIRPNIECLKGVKRDFYFRFNKGIKPDGYKDCPVIRVSLKELPKVFRWARSQRPSDEQTAKYKAACTEGEKFADR